MIDSATCNATDLAACPTTAPPTVDVGASPDDVEVDQATHTVYVTTIGALSGWSVFDANTCNATDQSGCATIGYLTGDPIGPNAAQVDTANDTLYTANFDNTVSAFDLHDCDAADLSGCATEVPGTVTVPPGAGLGIDHVLWLAVDAPLHSVYVALPEGRRAEGDQHEPLQRRRSSRLRNAKPARDPHGHGPGDGPPRPADPDAVHRQRGRQRRLGDRRDTLQRADDHRLPSARAR